MWRHKAPSPSSASKTTNGGGHSAGKFAQWLDVRNVDAGEAVQFLKPAPDDYFVFEPTVIVRNAPPPKPKAQLNLL
jgi:hypothetical protein